MIRKIVDILLARMDTNTLKILKRISDLEKKLLKAQEVPDVEYRSDVDLWRMEQDGREG